MPEIISRKEAIALGLKRYFTGLPCCYGHLCERYVSGPCTQCDNLRTRQRDRRAYANAWNEAHPGYHLTYQRINPEQREKHNERSRQSRLRQRAALIAIRELGIKF